MTPKQLIAFDTLCDRLAALHKQWDAAQKKSAQTARGIVDAAKSAAGPDVKRHCQRLHDHLIDEHSNVSAALIRDVFGVAREIEQLTHRAYRRERSKATR